MKLATKLSTGFVLGALSFACVSVSADDWPQWRGPARDAVSKETALLREWPADGPALAWESKDIGEGYSTPAVVGDRLYVLGNEGLDNEFVRALSVADGKRVWSTKIGKVGPNIPAMNYPGARSTPTVDGDALYALGSDGDLVCIGLADGAVRWQKNLRTDFGGKPGDWAYSESPLVDGDAVICTPGGETATIVSLNKKTGDVLWKSQVPGGDTAGYASAIRFDFSANSKQYIQFLQSGLTGIDANDGKVLWRYGATAKGSPANIPTAIVKGDLVYSATHRGGGGLIRIKESGGKFEPEQLYFGAKLPMAIGGAVLVGDHLYGTGGQVLMCIDFKTGDLKWTDRSIGASSILYADGMLILHGENGEVALVKASPDAYKELGRFTPSDAPDKGRSKSWAYPVLANGKLYIRDWTKLWCYDVKGQASASNR